MKNSLIKIVLSSLLISSTVNAVEGDNHKNHRHNDKKSSHSDHHDDEHDHDDHKDDDHHEHEHDEHKHSKKEENEHDHSHEGKRAIGKGKAIVEVDEAKGFRLSQKSIKSLKLKLKTIDGPEIKISKKSLVSFKNKKGVYLFRSGYFKFFPAIIKKKTKKSYLLNVKGANFGDQVVVNGVKLLRVSDVYSTDKSDYGHSH